MAGNVTVMSVVDAVQLISKARGVIGGMLGRNKEEGKTSPETEVKGDESLPTGLLTEKFTRKDESHWQLLMTYLEVPVSRIIRKLVVQMSHRDKADSGNRVDSFRIGVLIMPNKITEETETETTSAPKGKKDKEEKEKPVEKTVKTTTRKIDPRFTNDDARVKYLKYLSDLTNAEMKPPCNKSEDNAIVEVIKYLEADEFIATGEMIQKAKKLGEKSGDAVFEETLRFRLGAEEYDRIKRENPRVPKKRLRELRLAALKEREDCRKVNIERGRRKNLEYIYYK